MCTAAEGNLPYDAVGGRGISGLKISTKQDIFPKKGLANNISCEALSKMAL